MCCNEVTTTLGEDMETVINFTDTRDLRETLDILVDLVDEAELKLKQMGSPGVTVTVELSDYGPEGDQPKGFYIHVKFSFQEATE